VTTKVCPSVASGEGATEIKPAQLTPKKKLYMCICIKTDSGNKNNNNNKNES